MLIRLAWRNIWRNRGRSLMTVGAVAVVVIITLAFFGLTGAARNGIYVSLTRAAGHLQIHAAGYRTGHGLRESLIDAPLETLATLAKTLPEAEIVSALAVPGLIESEGRSYGILLQGLEQPDAVRDRYASEYLVTGELPVAADPDGIALGEKLAANLQVAKGDTVYLYAPGTDGYGASAYTVTGLLKVPNSEAVAVSSLRAAQELAAPEALNRIEVTFPGLKKSSDDSVIAELRARTQIALGESYAVEPWSAVSPDMAGFIDYFRRVSLIFALIFFILAGLLVANTVYLSVIERVREFGLLHALGTPATKVVIMVLCESLFLCLCGAFLGLAAGSLIVTGLARGVSFPGQVADFLAEQGLPRVFYGSVSPQEIMMTVLFTLITAVLAALLPALSAGRLEPAEAMRFTA